MIRFTMINSEIQSYSALLVRERTVDGAAQRRNTFRVPLVPSWGVACQAVPHPPSFFSPTFIWWHHLLGGTIS